MRFVFSNSSTKSWHFCRRAFFNSQLRDGGGYEPVAVEEDLLFGTLMHEIVALAWGQAPNLDEEIERRAEQLRRAFLDDASWEADLTLEARAVKAQEWMNLFVGMAHGVQRVVLPFLQTQYELVSAEGDAVRWLPDWRGEIGGECGLIAKPDLLLYPKEVTPIMDDAGMVPHPGIGYLEWKTVSSPNAQWQKQWVRNPQAWTGAMTVKAALGVEIEWFMVCGLVKGVEHDGRRVSPFCYVYGLAPGEPTKVDPATFWTTADGWRWRAEYTSAKGWVRIRADVYPGGAKQLVQDLPAEVVQKQFVLTPPDDIDWDLAEEWLENQRPLAVAAVMWSGMQGEGWLADEEAKRRLLQTLFPRSLEKCKVGMAGRGCAFERLCHDPEVAKEPLMVYRKRVPHHALEKALELEGEGER